MSRFRCLFRCGVLVTALAFACAVLNATGQTSVSFIWNRNTEPNLAGYKLYVGDAPRTYSPPINVGMVTNYTLSALQPGSTYYFALTAFNTAGTESSLTPELTYQVPAVPSNAPPTLNPITNLNIPEDAGQQTVALSGISSGSMSENQPLTVTAVSSHPNVIPTPMINYTNPNSTGSLLIRPVQNASGFATVTVTVDDGQASNSRVSRSFTVSVNAVNDLPSFYPLPDVVVNERTPEYFVQVDGISPGAPNENDTLTLTATSSQPDLIPNPTVSYSSPDNVGLITLHPDAGSRNAMSRITVTLSDGRAQNGTFSRTFSVTVQADGSPPVISSIPDQRIPRNRPSAPIPFTVSDTETPAADLQVTAISSNPSILSNDGLIFGGSGTDRTLTLDPANGRADAATVTVTVNDGTSTSSTSFDVSVGN